MYATTVAFAVLLPAEPVAIDLTHLYSQLHMLPNQWARRGVRYPLPMLLMVTILAKLTGQSQLWAIAEWAALRADDFAARFQVPVLPCRIGSPGAAYSAPRSIWLVVPQIQPRPG